MGIKHSLSEESELPQNIWLLSYLAVATAVSVDE